MPSAILLSGPPATGKDAVTAALHCNDKRIVHFTKHRAGVGGQTASQYLDVDVALFKHMEQHGDFLQWHSRYGRYYGVSSQVLQHNILNGLISVIHVCRYENLLALRSRNELRSAISILLMCSRQQVRLRLEERHQGHLEEIERRLSAFDEEIQLLHEKLVENGSLDFDLVIDTTYRSPDELAATILSVITQGISADLSRVSQITMNEFLR